MLATRRITTLIAALSVAALSLTACGSSSSSGDAAAGGKVTITFQSWEPTEDQWPAIIAAFEKENPDITVKYSRQEDYDTYKTNLDNEILANKVPDLYGIQVGSSFNDYSQYAVDVKDYASSWIDDINNSSLSQTTDSKGDVKAVPVLMAGMEYYLYNKTLMDKLGLSLPTNFDELVSDSEKAQAAGYTSFALGAKDAWHDADFFTWLSTQYGGGDDIYQAAAGKIKWDSPNLVAAATQWQKLFTSGVFEKGATTVATYPNARDDYFLAGKSVFFPTGSWHVSAALATSTEVPGSAIAKDQIGMAAFPVLGQTDRGVTSGVDFALAVSNSSSKDKQEAAEKFTQFLADGQGQQVWINTLQGFPASKKYTIQLGKNESALGKQSVDLVSKTLQASTKARKPVDPNNTALEDKLGVVLQNIADGDDPAQQLASLNN